MKLTWRIAIGTACAVVLAAAVIAAVPTSRAAAGGFFAEVFHIQSGPQAELGYIPEGFKAGVMASAGTASIAADGQEAKSEEQAFYVDGDKFVLVTTTNDEGGPLPQGQATRVNGLAAVLTSGLSGSATVVPPVVDGAPVDGAQLQSSPAPGAPSGPVNVVGSAGGSEIIGGLVSGESMVVTSASDGAPAAGWGSAPPPPSGAAVAESGISVSVDSSGGPATVVNGVAPDMPAVDYTDGNRLTWVVNGTRVEILSNLPLAELVKIAEGLVLNGG